MPAREAPRPRSTALAVLAALAVLVPYALLHLRWLPGPDGLVGHDWSYVMPRLLAGGYWLERNGPLEPPWFTPAFLAGTPFLAHPASAYASALQVVSQYFGPLAAARTLLVGGAAIGYAGAWLLARRALGASHAAAIVAATVFAWNGFHSTRMLVGHAGFHGSMLVPLAAFWIVRPIGTERRARELARDGLCAGLVLAYLVMSGNVYGLPPAALAIAAIAGIAALRGGSLADAAIRAGVAVGLALVVCGAKLWAGLAFLANAPRSGYPLPGFDGPVAAVAGVARALFLAAPADGADAGIVNTRHAIGGHELDFGVTFVPLALVVAWIAFGRARWRERVAQLRARPIAALVVAVAIALPIAVNVHGASWTPFLKSLPLVSSSSNLLRWLWTFVPLAAVGAALAVDGIRAAPRARAAIAGSACVSVIAATAFAGAGARVDRAYDPARVEAASRALRERGVVVPIVRNDVVWNARGEPSRPVGRDDLLADGASQLLAYEPLFGYDLEWFPMGALHPGDPFEERDGALNAKDPASFLFPERNGGAVGAHVTAADRARLAAFLDYRPIAWSRPAAFDVVAWAGAAALALSLVFVVATARATGRT